MPSGIFGPRTPQGSYQPVNPSYRQTRPVYPSYARNAQYAQSTQYVPPVPGYPWVSRYPALPQYAAPTAPVPTPQAGYYPFQALQPLAAPLNPVYPSVSHSAGSGYSTVALYSPETLYYSVPQTWMGEPSKGLETILIAILVLVSLDLVLLRPLKQNR